MTFKSLYSFFHQHPEGQWIMKPEKAQILWTFLKEHDIKNVLDLGTGIGVSAAICSLALSEKAGDFHIDTVEQSEKCFTLAQKLIPEELKKNISFHHQSVVVWQTPKIPYQPLSNFKELPEGQWDLIITDGPGEFLAEDGHFINLPNGDVLKMHMEEKIPKGTFLFYDGRMKSLSILERYYANNFYTLEAINSTCNILERKDNPVEMKDERKVFFEQVGYF